MILLARTTPLEEVKKPSKGLSLFCIDLDRAAPGLNMRKIKKMGGRAIDANEVFFDNYWIRADTVVGTEGQGFKTILHGMNAERCLLAGEALGLDMRRWAEPPSMRAAASSSSDPSAPTGALRIPLRTHIRGSKPPSSRRTTQRGYTIIAKTIHRSARTPSASRRIVPST